MSGSRLRGGARISVAAVMACLLTGHSNAKTFDIPTGAPPSPLFGALPFTQEMNVFEEFGTRPMPAAYGVDILPVPAVIDCTRAPDGALLDAFFKKEIFPQPLRLAFDTGANPWATAISNCIGPLTTSFGDGRPPGESFAHQRWDDFTPQAYFMSPTTGARVNGGLRDTMQRHGFAKGEFAVNGLYYHGGTNKNTQVRFHPKMPVQDPRAVWTFDGTLPPKLLMARYGEPVLFRHYNALPIDPSQNFGFGTNTLSTHYHNGHHPAESDGFTAAYFFPGQYYDYRWPMALAGHDTINTGATDPRAGAPNGSGGITKVRGDWRETMSTHWFHDHRLDFTAQNVYKGSAAMANLYSAVDRGREGFQCNYTNAANPNLCLPSGTALDWGNRDYDVNLMIHDKAWDANGQLYFNIFNREGFIADRMMVNWTFKPYFNVRQRRYRFRMLNASVSRNFKIAIATATGQRVPYYLVANDGNIMEHAVPFPNAQSKDLPEMGIAERYDIVVDFKTFAPGTKIYLYNLIEQDDGRGPRAEVPLASIVNNKYTGDPAVGSFLELRVVKYTGADQSMNPADYVEGKKKMIPLPTFTAAELASARKRTFDFGRSNNTDEMPWTIKTDGGQGYGMDPHRVSAAPKVGDLEIWHLVGSDGWTHPVHIHFEEGIILKRDGRPPPLWEKYARKDVYRIGGFKDSSLTIDLAIRFREFAGTFLEHCHNTQHEDHSMLLRWDVRNPGQTIAIPTPISTWQGVYYEPSFDLINGRDPAVAGNSGPGGGGSSGPGGGGSTALAATTPPAPVVNDPAPPANSKPPKAAKPPKPPKVK